MESNKIMMYLLAGLFLVIFVGVVANSVSRTTHTQNFEDFEAITTAGNVTLDYGYIQTVNNITNTTGALINTAQYNDFTSSGLPSLNQRIELVDATNITVGIVVNYDHNDGVVTGSSSILVTIILLMFVALVISALLYRKNR